LTDVAPFIRYPEVENHNNFIPIIQGKFPLVIGNHSDRMRLQESSRPGGAAAEGDIGKGDVFKPRPFNLLQGKNLILLVCVILFISLSLIFFPI
jgi:hypothetical protein